jgi:hypothetical protein
MSAGSPLGSMPWGSWMAEPTSADPKRVIRSKKTPHWQIDVAFLTLAIGCPGDRVARGRDGALFVLLVALTAA